LDHPWFELRKAAVGFFTRITGFGASRSLRAALTRPQACAAVKALADSAMYTHPDYGPRQNPWFPTLQQELFLFDREVFTQFMREGSGWAGAIADAKTETRDIFTQMMENSEKLGLILSVCERDASSTHVSNAAEDLEKLCASRPHSASFMNRCQCCNKIEPKKNAFGSCSRCNKAGIKVYFCSRECIQKAWKEGHKQVCGKIQGQ
jgi:hypothetical protein